MGREKKFVRNLILIFLGLVVTLNILGLVVELLIQVNVINVGSVNIKGILSPTLVLSLAFIVSGIIFWIRFYKGKNKLVMWWNIFMSTMFLLILSKIIWPTILVKLIPLYFLVVPCIAILIWLLVFKYLKKSKSSNRYGWSSF